MPPEEREVDWDEMALRVEALLGLSPELLAVVPPEQTATEIALLEEAMRRRVRRKAHK